MPGSFLAGRHSGRGGPRRRSRRAAGRSHIASQIPDLVSVETQIVKQSIVTGPYAARPHPTPLSRSTSPNSSLANRSCSRRSRQPPHQAAGFRMVVPGIGSGSCECRKPLARIRRTKSACFFSCCEGFRVPGVTSPIRLPCCSRTRHMASAMSLSLLTTAKEGERLLPGCRRKPFAAEVHDLARSSGRHGRVAAPGPVLWRPRVQ